MKRTTATPKGWHYIRASSERAPALYPNAPRDLAFGAAQGGTIGIAG
ncbi:MAG: hypothetical protein ABNH53_12740 [Henriciella sp.]